MLRGFGIQESVSTAQRSVNHLSSSTSVLISESYNKLKEYMHGFNSSRSFNSLERKKLDDMIDILEDIKSTQGQGSFLFLQAQTFVFSTIQANNLISKVQQPEDLEFLQFYNKLLDLTKVPDWIFPPIFPPIAVTRSPTITQTPNLYLPDMSHEYSEKRRRSFTYSLETNFAQLYYFLKIIAKKIDFTEDVLKVNEMDNKEIDAVIKIFGFPKIHLKNLVIYTKLTQWFCLSIDRANKLLEINTHGESIFFTYFIFHLWMNLNLSLKDLIDKLKKNDSNESFILIKLIKESKILKNDESIKDITIKIATFKIESKDKFSNNFSYAFVAMMYVMSQGNLCPMLTKKLETEENLFQAFFADKEFLQSKGIKKPLSWYINNCQEIPYSTVTEQIFDQVKLLNKYQTIENNQKATFEFEKKYKIKRSTLKSRWKISLCMNFEVSLSRAENAIKGWLKADKSVTEYKNVQISDMILYIAYALANENLPIIIREKIFDALQKHETIRPGTDPFRDFASTRQPMILPYPDCQTADFIARHLLEFRQERKINSHFYSTCFARQKGLSKATFNNWVIKEQCLEEALKNFPVLNPQIEAAKWILCILQWSQANKKGSYPIKHFCTIYLPGSIREVSFHTWLGAFLAAPTIHKLGMKLIGDVWGELAKEGYYQGNDRRRLENIASLFLKGKQENVFLEKSLSSLEIKCLKELQAISLRSSTPTDIRSPLPLDTDDIPPLRIDKSMKKDIEAVDGILKNIKINLNNLQEHISQKKIKLDHALSDVLNHRILFMIKERRATVKLFSSRSEDAEFLFKQLKNTTSNKADNRMKYYFPHEEETNKIDLLSHEVFVRRVKKGEVDIKKETSYTCKTSTTLLPAKSEYMELFVGTKEIKIGTVFDFNNCDLKNQRYFFKEDVHSNLCFWIDVEKVEQKDKSPDAKPLYCGGLQRTILKQKHFPISLEEIQKTNEMAIEKNIRIKWNELMIGLPEKKCEAFFSPRDTLPYRLWALYMMFFAKEMWEFSVYIPIMIITNQSPPEIYSEKSRLEDFVFTFQFGENSPFYKLLWRNNFDFSKKIIRNYLDSTSQEVNSLRTESNGLPIQKMYSEEFLNNFLLFLEKVPSFREIEMYLISHLWSLEVIVKTFQLKERSFTLQLLSNDHFKLLKKVIQYHSQHTENSKTLEFLMKFLNFLDKSPSASKIQKFLEKKQGDLLIKDPGKPICASINMNLDTGFKEKTIINAFDSPLEVGVILAEEDRIFVVNEDFLKTKLKAAGMEISIHGNGENMCLPFATIGKNQTQDIAGIHQLATRILKELGLEIFLMSHWGDFQYWGKEQRKIRYYRAKLVGDLKKDQGKMSWVNHKEVNRYINLFNIEEKFKSSKPIENSELPRSENPVKHPKCLEGRKTKRSLKLYYPNISTDQETWTDASKLAILAIHDTDKKDMLPPEINGISFKTDWNPPKNLEDWEKFANTHVIEGFNDPKVPHHAFRLSAGVIIQESEQDGRVWMVAPSNKFGGYDVLFPQGTVEQGYSLLLTALKEGQEECGLEFTITNVLYDLERPGGRYLRIYQARRIGGHPKLSDAESQAILLVRPGDVNAYSKLL